MVAGVRPVLLLSNPNLERLAEDAECVCGNCLPLPARPCLQVLRKQREKDAELARVRAEREAEAALRALERKLQLQDKVRR